MAIGRNIFPSTPVSDNTGINTIKIIICPNIADCIIFEAPLIEIASINDRRFSAGKPFESELLRFIFITIYSTIITAPSMIIPKSSAPKLIRFASIPKIYIIEMVNSNARGIIDVITRAERKFPSSKITVNITMTAPSTRFSATVKVVLATSSLRSTMGLIEIPSGKFSLITSTRCLTSLITSFEFAFLSIITCPKMVSPFPLAVIAP